eukprot:Gb_29378 [translate_table: standard]
MSTCFVDVTNQKYSSAYRASNLEISLNHPAQNDSMWKDLCEEGLLESKKHDLGGVNCIGGQNILIVGTMAIDLRGINYDNPFVLIVSPMVIDIRVYALRVPTLGTMVVSTIAVDSNIPDLDMYKNLEEEGQKIKGKLTGQEFQDQGSFYRKVDDWGSVNFGELSVEIRFTGNEEVNHTANIQHINIGYYVPSKLSNVYSQRKIQYTM